MKEKQNLSIIQSRTQTQDKLLKILFNYLIITLHISSKLNNCNDLYIHTYLYLVILVIRQTLK